MSKIATHIFIEGELRGIVRIWASASNNPDSTNIEDLTFDNRGLAAKKFLNALRKKYPEAEVTGIERNKNR